MSSQEAYQSISELASALAKKTALLETGDMSADALQSLTEDCRELYERLVVLRFHAFREMTHGDSAEAPAPPEKSPVQELPSEEVANDPGEFKISLGFDDTQTSLIDAIEEIEQEAPADEPEPRKPAKEPDSKRQPVKEEPALPAGSIEKNPIEIALDDALDFEEEAVAQSIVNAAMEQEEKENSVNDNLATETESLADKLGKAPLEQIRGNISLNEKFLLINQVFGGDSEVYEATLKNLDEADGFQSALEIVEEIQPPFESKGTELLRELVERRFAST